MDTTPLGGAYLSLIAAARALPREDPLLGEEFSLADLCYLPFLEFLPLMEIAPPSHVAAWSERLLARPSAAATRPEK